MGSKDITEKTLEAYNDVFADIINVLLFNGELLVKEDELEEDAPRSSYKVKDKIHEMERDTSKFWKKFNVRIAFLGLENQTEPDPYMSLRIIGYDGTAYRAQLLDVDENGKIKGVYPVVTLVLYFGTKHWDKPKTLYETFSIPDELKPYVNDYRINLFEIAYLSDEQVNMFRSDFRYVADYFVQSKKNNDYKPAPGTIRHVHETLQLLQALTGDRRFEESARAAKGGANTMSELLLDRVEAKAEARGKELGKELGETLMNSLYEILFDSGRIDDAIRASKDEEYRNMLIEELLSDNKNDNA